MVETRYIAAGNLIDGSGGEARREVFLAVRDGVVAAIGSVADLPKGGAPIDDLSHCVILPPLVDCSVSLARSPSVDWRVRLASEEKDLSDKAAMVARHIGYCHAYGVLGIAASDDLTGLVDRGQTGFGQGGGVELRAAGGLWRSREDCAVGSLADWDFLKIDYSGNIEDREAPYLRLDQENLRRMLQHRGDRKAVVVANGRQQVGEALAAGCDAIEQGYGMGEANLRTMAERRVLWIPSVVRAKNGLDGSASGGEVCCRFSQRYVAPGKPDPGAEAFWKRMLGEQLEQLRLARKLGVLTAVGTGAGSVGILHGESVVEEMKLFIKAGYSLPETIRCASGNGARFFGMEKLGSLTLGRPATFLVTRGTVGQLPRKLSYLEGIYIDGVASATYCKNPVGTA